LNTVLQQNWQIYAMAVIVGFATVMVMRWWRYRRASGGGDSALLSIVLNNMTQGVILFDAHERILVCNNRYIEMYGVSPDVVKPGCTLLGLIENRITTGSLNIDPKKYRDEFLSAVRQGQSMNRIVETPDGRAIMVVNRSIKDGEYWIGTHDDITERIYAERKSSALSEQERRRVEIETEIQAFRADAAAVLQTVTQSTAALKLIAVALSNSSGRTSERTAGAVDTSNEASGNMTAGCKCCRRADRVDRRNRPPDRSGGRSCIAFGRRGTNDQRTYGAPRRHRSAHRRSRQSDP
jgi:transcriptional regulator with PAS, ATPase and Fis domain